jgi:hypothetical protein
MPVEHVKKAAEEADQMISELRKASQAESLEEATDEQVEEQVNEQLAESDQGISTTPPEPGNDWEEQARLWEQRYRSLNGMIQARDRQIQQLHDLLANMQRSTAAAPPAAVESGNKLLTKDDEDSYGADLVDMARRAGRQESMQLVANLEDKIARLEQSMRGVSQVSQVTLQERFERHLDSLTQNNWRTLDSDAAFMTWLEDSPTRKRVFAEGVQSSDARVVADFFNEYAQIAEVRKAADERPVQSRLRRLERQVAPGKSKGGSAPTSQGEDKMWTRSEIAQLYANKRAYPADEFAKLEREVAAAQRENRVDFNK